MILPIQEFRTLKEWREEEIVFKLGVVYQTSAKQLEEIPVLVRSIIEEQPDIAFDRGHFQSYGNFSLEFEFVYFILSSDYNKYMDIHQAINLKIYREFEKLGIEFAYPTQTLFINKENGSVENDEGNKSISEKRLPDK